MTTARRAQLAAAGVGGGVWTPGDLSGLKIWLKADQAGYNDQATMTDWPDLSSNNNDGTAVNGGTGSAFPKYHASVGGYPAVQFQQVGSYSYFTFGDPSLSTSAEVFVVTRLVNDPPSSAQSGLWDLSGDTSSSGNTHYPWTTGVIYDGAMSTARKTTVNPTPTLAGTWRLYSARSAASDWMNHLDNVPLYWTATNTFSNKTAPWLGSSSRAGGGQVGMDGYIAEFVLCSPKLSAADRASLISYFAAEYGLSINAYDNEVLADDPFLYWKLDEASGTTIGDASGHSRTGTMSVSGVLGATTWVDNNPAADLTEPTEGTGPVWGGSAVATGSSEVWYYRTTDLSGSAYTNITGPQLNSSYDKAFQFNYSGNNEIGFYVWDGAAKRCLDPAPYPSGQANTWIHAVATWDSTNLRLYINGELRNTVACGNAWTGDGTFRINPPWSSSPGFPDRISRVAVYNEVLSPERIAAHYAAAPYAFDPHDHGTLVAWYDAADTTTITATGGLVDQWNDKSGNGYHLTSTGTARPTTGSDTQNGRNILTFGGDDYLNHTGSTGMGTGSYSVFIVVEEISHVNGAGYLSMYAGTHDEQSVNGFVTAARGSTAPLGVLLNQDTVSTVVTTSHPNPMAVYDWVKVGTGTDQMTGHLNGSLNVTGTVNKTGTHGTGILVGGRWQASAISASFRLNGSIAEILVFDDALNSTNREAVQSYLLDKWGLP